MTPAFTAPEIPWAALAPLLFVLGAGVLGVLVETVLPDRWRRGTHLGLVVLGTGGALVSAALLWRDVSAGGGQVVLNGSLIIDGPTAVLQAILAALGLVSFLVIATPPARTPSPRRPRPCRGPSTRSWRGAAACPRGRSSRWRSSPSAG